MAHHGDEQIYAEQFKKLFEGLQQDSMKRLGATGLFPEGHLNKDDEGEIRIGITVDQGKVIMAFGKEISWIGFTKEQAIDIGNLLIEKAVNL